VKAAAGAGAVAPVLGLPSGAPLHERWKALRERERAMREHERSLQLEAVREEVLIHKKTRSAPGGSVAAAVAAFQGTNANSPGPGVASPQRSGPLRRHSEGQDSADSSQQRATRFEGELREALSDAARQAMWAESAAKSEMRLASQWEELRGREGAQERRERELLKREEVNASKQIQLERLQRTLHQQAAIADMDSRRGSTPRGAVLSRELSPCGGVKARKRTEDGTASVWDLDWQSVQSVTGEEEEEGEEDAEASAALAIALGGTRPRLNSCLKSGGPTGCSTPRHEVPALRGFMTLGFADPPVDKSASSRQAFARSARYRRFGLKGCSGLNTATTTPAPSVPLSPGRQTPPEPSPDKAVSSIRAWLERWNHA